MAVCEPSKSRTVKYVVRYGGVLTTRRDDFSSHYRGGCTRIIKLDRHTSYKNFTAKLREVSGCSNWKLRIKLDDETLITVTCAEDLEFMLHEHDVASAAHPSDPPKLEAFLTSPEHRAALQWSGPAPAFPAHKRVQERARSGEKAGVNHRVTPRPGRRRS
uniref:PB1 domain-containing protein n=1 Tax=Kalanchoe fedtschenkoi TaxID=63787 RepID=A0A7N0T503_KALFE